MRLLILAALSACSTSPPAPVPCEHWSSLADGRSCDPACSDASTLRRNTSCVLYRPQQSPIPADIVCDYWSDADDGCCYGFGPDDRVIEFHPGSDVCL
jgi:hypothetical protein